MGVYLVCLRAFAFPTAYIVIVEVRIALLAFYIATIDVEIRLAVLIYIATLAVYTESLVDDIWLAVAVSIVGIAVYTAILAAVEILLEGRGNFKSPSSMIWDRCFMVLTDIGPMQFTSAEYVISPSPVDNIKTVVEKLVGGAIGWRPLSPPRKACPPGYSNLWSVESRKIAKEKVDQCTSSRCNSKLKHCGFKIPILAASTGASTNPGQSAPSRVSSLSLDGEISDDVTFFKHLLKTFNTIRGFKGKWLSWKTCVDVEFIKFTRVFTSSDEVARLGQGLPPHVNLPSEEYEYSLTNTEEVHMDIAAKQIMAGMHGNGIESNIATTLQLMPKKCNLPLSYEMGCEGWSIHTMQGFSLTKFLVWMGSLIALGVIFVVCWLVLVSNTDFQNAFVTVCFFVTMIGLAVGVPQLLVKLKSAKMFRFENRGEG
ncbi:hypothetical protein G7Y89_g4899 [Cudoniella acicularis]|uniref:Uncharacterized protein n=1 Tax=Cudoniella acicularis TaxID=354080 RepID=A0A8H4RNI3_9HELO|nr:hypothetical protein G7Y89_g4899 [Cudoniella acicularis]